MKNITAENIDRVKKIQSDYSSKCMEKSRFFFFFFIVRNLEIEISKTIHIKLRET